MNERRFRFDLYVALLALLISGIAAGASAYQTYVIRQQFSATVWPYLTFTTRSSTDRYFELDLSNAGIGPALIRGAVVSRDGKPIDVASNPTASPALGIAFAKDQAEAKRDGDASKSHGNSSTTVSSIVRGDVVSAGSSLQLFRVEGKYVTRRVLADVRHVDVQICYCSLLGNCWTKRLWDPSDEPHAVGSCSA